MTVTDKVGDIYHVTDEVYILVKSVKGYNIGSKYRLFYQGDDIHLYYNSLVTCCKYDESTYVDRISLRMDELVLEPDSIGVYE